MKKELDSVLKGITPEQILNMEYGDEVELTDKYVLYKYAEEDIIVVVEQDEWIEVAQIMIDERNEKMELTIELL